MQLAKDKRIPYYFVAFFVGLAVVDGIMVTLAVRSHTGTVMEHPYEEGLAYNRTIDAANAQNALGWKSTFDFVHQGRRKGKVLFTLNDTKSAPIKATSVNVQFTRPTQAGHDFTVELHRIGERYSAIVQFPLHGLWEMRVFAEAEGVPYQQSKRIVVE